MKWNKNSLKVKVWLSFIIFSLIILAFLWIFQIFFINSYYEYDKIKTLNIATKKLKNIFNENNVDSLNELARDYGICIEIADQTSSFFISDTFNKGCINDYKGNISLPYRHDFISNNLDSAEYTLINPRFNNKTLINAIRLGEGYYAFVSASLEPLDTAVVLLKKQLFFITFIVLLLSFIIAYFISKKISKPIEKMNQNAKTMGIGNYQTEFDTDSGISEIDELAATLNYANQELGKTEDLRRDLLANVSHDLKTPLTMIKAYAEMVRDLTYHDDQKRNENLNVIIAESDRLNGLVNDILTLSSIQSQTVELEKTSFDIMEMIREIIKRYDILAEQEKYRFIVEGPAAYQIEADHKKMEQVIYNLINNAINYTGRNKKVTIRLTPDQDKALVEIIDTGKGIAEKDLPFIWDRYYHSEKKHQRNKVGTGLGLSIVKNILILHHYPYGVTSKEKEGTTFYFEIPKEKS